MTKHTKKGAGGKRAGAGLKTKNPKPHTIRVTAEEKKLIEALRAKNH